MKRKRYRHLPISNILTVECILETPSFAQSNYRHNPVLGNGLRYELAGHEYLLDIYGFEYIPGPWFRYSTEHMPTRKNFVQPDGLIIRLKEGIITIVEFKWSHTPDAYYQLVDRYLPLMEKFFGKDIFEFRLLEICRWYSPQIKFPGRSSLRKNVEDVKADEVGIHIWKP